MTLDSLNRWLSLMANIGVLIGILFLAIEFRQNSEYMALQLEFEQPTQKIFDINRDLQNPETARIVAKSIERPGELTFHEGLVASSFVLNMLNEWEDRYLIQKTGLKGEIHWQTHIEENIEWALGSQFAVEVYKSNVEAFEDEFVEYVDGLLPEISQQATHWWWMSLKANFQVPDSTED